MIDLVLVKKDMLLYMHDVRAAKGIGGDLSDHHVVLCKVRLVMSWVKMREVVMKLGGGKSNGEMRMGAC